MGKVEATREDREAAYIALNHGIPDPGSYGEKFVEQGLVLDIFTQANRVAMAIAEGREHARLEERRGVVAWLPKKYPGTLAHYEITSGEHTRTDEVVPSVPHNDSESAVALRTIERLESALAQAREELAKEREVIAVWCDESVYANLDDHGNYTCCAKSFNQCASFVRNRSKP